MASYKGRFTPKNKHKYVGDHKNIVYRSLWERNALRWLDSNPGIVAYSSEEVVIPYLCKTDNRIHRYFPDLWFQTVNGDKYLIEIKPEKEISPPVKRGNRRTKRYITESLTYIKNQSKWEAAQEFAADRGWEFQIWSERTLKSLGIKIIAK